ncbi:hypothetical protein LEP1GSC202_2601 [Leptospira yanagawae serovar Saopaulo str. Sao Paulo = ATCC 700523]|uniref:Uncharacterized protein n=1 Tax=Leptospira yanagawae serovar Saopaulo str. Sao Paulo = ATCC 700523 TaxID=1249483 RepID=A0A5E8H7E6_9LEPT|nr:hypothetical protein LEP1GSC202_2601 [Leptospira yanagawae serovar Saopaulo str. Sao Paulo = ATCC 700523]
MKERMIVYGRIICGKIRLFQTKDEGMKFTVAPSVEELHLIPPGMVFRELDA